MPLTPAQIQKIETYLDEEDHLSSAQGLGRQLHDLFDSQKVQERISSQVRNLQQIVLSASTLAEIEDFIKNQMGRDLKSKDWRLVGPPLLAAIRQLRQDAAQPQFGSGGQPPSREDQQQIRLRLARGWVRSVVSHYLYCKACAEASHA
jgi:hypothetical protein